MADVVVTKSVLQNVVGFVDGDTRTITIDNPAASIASGDATAKAAVQAWFDYAKTNNILIGDKAGAALEELQSSKVIDSTSTMLDLSTD